MPPAIVAVIAQLPVALVTFRTAPVSEQPVDDPTLKEMVPSLPPADAEAERVAVEP